MFSCISPNTNISLYADDTKIWRKINMDVDHIALQNDITALYQWSINNKMKFHPDKCKVLSVTHEHEKYYLPFTRYAYHLGDEILDYVYSETDLGIYVNYRLTWTTQGEKIYNKANSRLGMTKRACHFLKNQRQKRAIYLAMVKSHLEHGAVIWSPQGSTLLDRFESLQRRAIKWILGETDKSYTDSEYHIKRNDMQLLSIKSHFIFTDLKLFHKIFYGYINIPMAYYIIPTPTTVVQHHTRQAQYVLQNYDELLVTITITSHKLKETLNKYFYCRTARVWNDLPYEIRKINKVLEFETSLKAYIWANLEPD